MITEIPPITDGVVCLAAAILYIRFVRRVRAEGLPEDAPEPEDI